MHTLYANFFVRGANYILFWSKYLRPFVDPNLNVIFLVRHKEISLVRQYQLCPNKTEMILEMYLFFQHSS